MNDLEAAIAGLDPALQRAIRLSPELSAQIVSAEGARLRAALQGQEAFGPSRTGMTGMAPSAEHTVELGDAVVMLFGAAIGLFLVWLTWPVWLLPALPGAALYAAQRANRETTSETLTRVLDVVELALFGLVLLASLVLGLHLVLILWDWIAM
jgi:hypothetical protein